MRKGLCLPDSHLSASRRLIWASGLSVSILEQSMFFFLNLHLLLNAPKCTDIIVKNFDLLANTFQIPSFLLII